MKIGILFGAGAETVFGLDCGSTFSKKVLGLDDLVLNETISNYYKNKRLINWYPKYKSYSWNFDKLLKSAIRKKVLEEQNINYNTKTDYYEYVEEEFIKYVNKDDNEKKRIIDKYSTYIGILDEKFHTIISPIELGPQKFWSVVDCYTRAYLTICDKMIHEKKEYKDNIKWILNGF